MLFLMLFAENSLSQRGLNFTDENGLKQGLWIKKYSPNIIDTMNYKNDSLNGDYKSYFTSGDIRFHGEYEKGIQVGIWKYYGEKRERMVC